MKNRTAELVPLILVKNEEYWLPYALECARGHFDRYVIYDVGSADSTKQIIDNFVQSERSNAEFFVRLLPDCPPVVQGAFRNSMIAESLSDWYFILDGDELYTEASYNAIIRFLPTMKKYHEKDGLLYGMVSRNEVQGDLKTAYGVGESIPHHRVYHRTAIFGGTHPGEYPIPEQRGSNQMWLPNSAVCWHFHGALRSPEDAKTHGRLHRKTKPTYQRGLITNIDILKELPILMTQLRLQENPVLTSMREAYDI